jgi:hypothetical protein
MKYKVVQPSETSALGVNGVIMYDLIKQHKPKLFKDMKEGGTLIATIQRLEDEYLEQLSKLAAHALNASEAREIASPEITAQFGT